MAKSALEKQNEKKMRQDKLLAERKHRDMQKSEKNAKRAADRDARIQRAASIVNGQALVEGFRIMDKTAEEILRCLLACEKSESYCINYNIEIFPTYVHLTVPLELEKLVQYGMISVVNTWMGGGILTLLPSALSYFQDKEDALNLQRQRKEAQQMQGGSMVNVNGNVFSMVIGDNNTTTINYSETASALDEIKQSLEAEEIDDEAKQDARELLSEISEKIEANKKPTMIKAAFSTLKDFLIASGASVTAALIVQMLSNMG